MNLGRIKIVRTKLVTKSDRVQFGCGCTNFVVQLMRYKAGGLSDYIVSHIRLCFWQSKVRNTDKKGKEVSKDKRPFDI